MLLREFLVWRTMWIAGLAFLPCCRCAKLPSWRGPNTFFDGTLPSERIEHGFVSGDDGKIYIFGGKWQNGEKMPRCHVRRPKSLLDEDERRAFIRRLPIMTHCQSRGRSK
jgi:hypothetical protein